MTTDYLKRGRDASRKADLNTVSLALNAFFLDHRIYPESDSNGCLAPDTFTRTHPNYRTQIPYSPSGEQYDE